MSRKFDLTLLLVGILACAGCNKKKEADPTDASTAMVAVKNQDLIAVIDLNMVAQEIGARAKIDVALKNREEELMKQFNGLRAELGRRISELTVTNSDLNDQQQNELDKLTTENQTKLTLQAQAAQTQLVAHHAQLKQKLLNEIRPVAYEVAQRQGMRIVLTVDQVYAAGPNVDITADVIRQIKSINDAADVTAKMNEKPIAEVAVLPGGGDFMPR